MPFMGRDWRSPGEAWVKTESLGWQRMKIIESQLHLTACHQNHLACSWPPRNQFGQHMANNCNKVQDTDCCDKGMGDRRSPSSLASSRNTNSCDSSDSSGQSSASTSPTGTPEKNNTSRHIHPIAISSPYGRYSTSCCAHHSHLTNQDNNNDIKISPSNAHRAACNHTGCSCMEPRYLMGASPQMSRSLSRETIIEPNCKSPSDECSHKLLRHNNSVADFRNTTSSCDSTIPSEKTTQYPSSTYGTSETMEKQCDVDDATYPKRAFCHTPILMENGVQIEHQEIADSTSTIEPKSHSTARAVDLVIGANYNDDRSASPPTTPISTPSQDIDQSCHSTCSCCCCCCCCPSHSNKPHHCIIKEQLPKTAPHCRISVRTREVAMHNTISEAFYRLDFYNAIHDVRRFNYICKLLHLLITQNLTSLSGCATRVLFTMLEQVAWEVSSNKRNIHVIRNLLDELRLTIRKYYCWGRPIGSSLLWQQHFETIERIGQIVNGIELSPPKDENYRVTFNNLPVEMIREILIRLNDYRDLINSAQASPLMRAMIDDQCIWRKLCRYHFTDQQLKLAFQNKDLVGVRRHTLRGIKYARTTSADGRSSYRKPVTHKLSSSSSSSSPSNTTTRQQLEETADRRNPNAKLESNSTSSKSSQVTDAVKIFDRAHRPTGSGSGQSSSSSGVLAQHSTGEKENQPQRLASSPSHLDGNRPLEPSRPGLEIDWERAFHQLRKRFDLKEEYADCLLLCRHCRCLFWKSFGHPCIKSDDLERENSRLQSGGSESFSTNGGNGRNQPCHLRSREASTSSSSRRSVASLSRNFDRQVSSGGPVGGENMEPRNLEQQRAALNANQNHDNEQERQRADAQRRPLNDLGARLRERNANRLNRQQNRHLNAQEGAHLGVPGREELVPKHVTITPQAFLKFFSL